MVLGGGEEGGAAGGVGIGVVGLGVEAVGAATFEGEDLGAVVGQAEAVEGGEEFAEELPAGLGIFGGVEEVSGGEGEVGGQELRDRVGEGGGAGGGSELGGGFGEAVEAGALVLRFLPIGEPALLPVGEVNLIDGLGVEERGQDGLDFGEGVEPGGELFGFVAVVEALVELVADVAGKAGDFAVAVRVHGGGVVEWWSGGVMG